MSAFIVSKETIDYIVNFSKWKMTDGYNIGNIPVVYRDGGWKYRNPDQLGQLLWEENHRSVNYRYSSHPSEKCPVYEFKTPPSKFGTTDINGQRFEFRSMDPGFIAKLVDCYEYQTCETEDWPKTDSYSFINALRMHLLKSLETYAEAPWGI